MDASSVAAVTATRCPATSSDAAIPPTDLLVLHSAAKLSLYVGPRHVCDIRLKLPGLNDSLSPYKGFMKQSHAASHDTPAGMVYKP